MAILNKININPQKQKLIIYIFLIVVTFAVFYQVKTFGFINVDDQSAFIGNSHVQSGITLDGIYWAFSTSYTNIWHPLTYLSYMFDYQLYGLNAGGYHITNLIIHILSVLLLFWFFNRMTGMIWRSAFIAAFFAFHPNHVESVAWISGRKDVLSTFFWMLTLCFYVYYTEKPVIKRYLLVLLGFVCGLMSKSMVVTLPVVMILLDYWPLKRFESKKDNLFLWQFKEKTPFFILSAVFSIMTLFFWRNSLETNIPMSFRLKNAPVAFMTYLEKILWPHDIHFWHLFSDQLLLSHVLGASILIILISIAVIVMMKRRPYLFVGWFWYAITLLPVVGIIKYGVMFMHEHYTYLPSIGIGIMLVWGVPSLFPCSNMRKKILFPLGIIFLAVMAIISWQQCSYWKNSFTLFSHGVKITSGNDLAMEHLQLGRFLFAEGKIKEAIEHFNEVVSIKSYYADALVYNERGVAYAKLGQYQRAIEDFNKAISISSANINSHNYNYRGLVYAKLGQYQNAISDFNEAIQLNPYYADSYNNRAIFYLKQKNYFLFCSNARKACMLGNCKTWEASKNEAYCR
jgi:protein O-mannosyl-transferase